MSTLVHTRESCGQKSVFHTQGWIQGRGSWGSGPLPPFGGSPNFTKREKNVVRVCAKMLRFST